MIFRNNSCKRNLIPSLKAAILIPVIFFYAALFSNAQSPRGWNSSSDSTQFLQGTYTAKLNTRDRGSGERRYFEMTMKFNGNQVKAIIDNKFIVGENKKGWGETKGNSAVYFNHTEKNYAIDGQQYFSGHSHDIQFQIGPYVFFGELDDINASTSWGEMASGYDSRDRLKRGVRSIEGFFYREESGGRRYISPFMIEYDENASGKKMSDEPILQIEKNPATGTSYKGIVADGENHLTLDVKAPERELNQLIIEKPSAGSIHGASLVQQNNGNYILSSLNEVSELKFHPPDYITSDDINYYHENPKAGCRKVPLFIKEQYKDGSVENYTLNIYVHRPPVVLVHGFTGDSSTWKLLDFFLETENFNTQRGEYYAGDESIPAQSERLSRNIKEKIKSYQQKRVKTQKVDIVAHSMGGLISHYYINETDGYDNDVRKLIMVATPNHGVSWWSNWAGNRMAEHLEKHIKASKQLYYKSDVIKALNEGEDTGKHLHPQIEYGNIYSYSPRKFFDEGDIIVPAASAYLNGVYYRLLRGMTHSPAVESISPHIEVGPSITTEEVVFDQVIEWLQKPIPSKSLDGLRMNAFVKGFYVFQPRGQEPQRKNAGTRGKRFRMNRWDRLKIIDGQAIIHIVINDKHVGRIVLAPKSDITIEFVSPTQLQSKLVSGKGRFITNNGVMHHSVELVSGEGYKRVTALSTDFVINMEEAKNPIIKSLEGDLIVKSQSSEMDIKERKLQTNEAALIKTGGVVDDFEGKIESWWQDLKDENIENISDQDGKSITLDDQQVQKPEDTSYPWEEKETDDDAIYWILGFVLILLFLFIRGGRKKRKAKKQHEKKEAVNNNLKTTGQTEQKKEFYGEETATSRPEFFMHCPHCNEIVDESAQFCTHCGKQIVTEPTEVFCTQCGTPNQPEANFCMKCGSPLKG